MKIKIKNMIKINTYRNLPEIWKVAFCSTFRKDHIGWRSENNEVEEKNRKVDKTVTWLLQNEVHLLLLEKIDYFTEHK